MGVRFRLSVSPRRGGCGSSLLRRGGKNQKKNGDWGNEHEIPREGLGGENPAPRKKTGLALKKKGGELISKQGVN